MHYEGYPTVSVLVTFDDSEAAATRVLSALYNLSTDHEGSPAKALVSWTDFEVYICSRREVLMGADAI